MLDSTILSISNRNVLKIYLTTNKINWSQLEKFRKKNSDFPIFKLLESQPGKTLGEKAYRILHGSPVCKTCNINSVVFYNWNKGFSIFCSRGCAGKNADLQQRITKSRESTMIDRYGAPTSLQSAQIKEKIQKTNIERYGGISPQSNIDVKNKSMSTLFDRYGVLVPCKNKSIAEKSGQNKKKSTFIKRINDLNDRYDYVDSTEFSNTESKKWRCVKCNDIFSHHWGFTQREPICRTCYPMVKGTSVFETELFDFISSKYAGLIERNKRFYFGKQYYELDLFIPEFNLGIEFNGLYWHSELAGKDRNYHSSKKKFFDSLNVKSLFVFEHEWMNKEEICKSLILHKLKMSETKIYARKCTIKNVHRKDVKQFLNENHIAGYADYSKAYALMYNEEIVGLATFKSDRFGKDKSVTELIRFCTRKNCSVPGALSRLLNEFHKNNSGQLKTFCDLRWGDGDGYKAVGFTLDKISAPCCWYFNKTDVYHRSRFQRKKLLSLLNLTYSELTEWELAQQLNLNRFWDCGNLVLSKQG